MKNRFRCLKDKEILITVLDLKLVSYEIKMIWKFRENIDKKITNYS